MTISGVLWLAIFAGLILAVTLQLLAASGHFPLAVRGANMRTRSAAVLLWVSLAVTLAALCAGAIAGGQRLPWQGLIIAGGLALLTGPLILQKLPDRFVDGHAALVTFAAGAAMCAVALVFAASVEG